MRLKVLVVLMGMFAVACGGGGGSDTGRFCELMEELAGVIGEAGSDPESALESLEEIEALASEAAEVAPEAIADTFNSTDPAEQEEVTTYVEEECGVEIPGA